MITGDEGVKGIVTTSRRVVRPLMALVAGAGLLLLPACSSVKGMFGGGEDDVILPGKREAVMPENTTLKPTPALATEPVVVPAAQTNASWPQPGGVPSNALHNLALGSQLQKLWSVSAGNGSDRDGRLTAPPIVVGGRIYVMDAGATVNAFDAQSGGRAWSVSLVPEGQNVAGGYGGGLASDGTRVYAATGFGEVVALDSGSGAIAWRKQTEVPFRAAPTVANGKVLAINVNNELYSFSTADGSEQWRFQGVGDQAAVISNTSPAVADGTVVAPYTSGELIAFRESDGIPMWGDALTTADSLSSVATLTNIAGRPVIDRGQVFAIAHSGRMGAFSLKEGQRLWVQDISGIDTPWVAGDHVFVMSGRNTLVAVSRKDGGIRWTANLPAGQRWTGPVLGGGQLIVVSSNGALAHVSPQTGEILSQVDLGETFYIPPVIANSTIYLLSDDATLIAMR